MKSVAIMLVASFYTFAENGDQTASGKRFDDKTATCAHRTMKFGTNLRIRFGRRTVRCVITDRGPYIAGRDLDLSLGAAKVLGPEFIERGVARVMVEAQ